jgi:hypothetical protein
MILDLDVFSYIYKLRQNPNEFRREKILRPIRAFPRPHRHRPQCHPPLSHGVLIAFPSFLIASTAWGPREGKRDAGKSASARQGVCWERRAAGLPRSARLFLAAGRRYMRGGSWRLRMGKFSIW